MQDIYKGNRGVNIKKSHCCNEDMIYLGKNNMRTPIQLTIGDTFNYCCSKCGRCEWSTEKEKTKYKWYKFDRDKLKELLKLGDDN